MNRRLFFPSLCALTCGTYESPVWAAGNLVVIAHPSNPTNSLGLGEVQAFFATRKLYWPHGGQAQVFNFPPNHEKRVAFDRKVLAMDPDQAARYWVDQRVRGGNRPPRQVPSADIMVRIVGTLKGAVGYAAESDLTSAVKVIARI